MWFMLLLIIVLLLLLVGILYQYVSYKLDRRRFPLRGKLVNIDAHDLHVVVTQSFVKGPTVVLEAGNGLTSSAWMLIQPEIAKFANCISYDRAGFGWSDNGKTSYTSQDSVQELHSLLEKLNLPKPYILVGHSYGGMLSQLYNKLYPDEVAGIVLVDTYHERQPDIVPLPSAMLLNVFQVINFLGIFRLFIQKLFPLPKTLPKLVRQRIHAEIANYNWMKTTKQTFANIKENFSYLKNLPVTNTPFSVLSAGLRTGPEYKVAHKINALQKELVARSTRGEQIIVPNSGHNIPFVEPEVIIKSVQNLVKLTHDIEKVK